MDEKRFLSQIEKDFSQMQADLDRIENQGIFQKDAFRKALSEMPFRKKVWLIYHEILKRVGVIPAYSLDEYRRDFVLQRDLQKLRNSLTLLVEKEEIAYKKNAVVSEQEVKETTVPYKVNKLKSGYIAILVNNLDKGGVEQVVAMLALGFRRRGLEVRVLCLQGGGMIADRLISEGIFVKIFQNSSVEFKRYILKNPPLIVNTHFISKHIRFLKKQHIPVVEVIHNMYVFFSKRRIRLEQKNENYFTKLIAVSEIVKETYISRIKNTQKLVVIGNAANQKEKEIRSVEEIKIQLEIPKDSFVLLNVSSIDSRKNQIGIAQAFCLVRQLIADPIYLVFAGNVQDSNYENKLRNEIEKCGNKEYIKLLAYYSEVRELYNMADVFVLDSYYEGWSIAATEALYEGLPVIHSMCGSARELTGCGRYGIMIPNPAGNFAENTEEQIMQRIRQCENRNIQDLVVAILSMYGHRDWWKNQRVKIREETRSNFAENAMIGQYISLFEELV